MSSIAIQYLLSHLYEPEDRDQLSEDSFNDIKHEISTALSLIRHHRNAEAIAVLLHLLPRVPHGNRFKAIRSLIYRLQDEERRGEIQKDLEPRNTIREEGILGGKSEIFTRKSGIKGLNTQTNRRNTQPIASNSEAVVRLSMEKAIKRTTYLIKLVAQSIQALFAEYEKGLCNYQVTVSRTFPNAQARLDVINRVCLDYKGVVSPLVIKQQFHTSIPTSNSHTLGRYHMHSPAAIFSDQIGSVKVEIANSSLELSESLIYLENAVGNVLVIRKTGKNVQMPKPNWKELVAFAENTVKELEFQRKSLGRDNALEELYTGNYNISALMSTFKQFLTNNDSFESPSGTLMSQIRLPTDIIERTTLLIAYLDYLPNNSLFSSPLYCVLSHIKCLFPLICRTNSYQIFCYFKDRALLFALVSILELEQAKLSELKVVVIMKIKENELFLQCFILPISPYCNENSNETTKNSHIVSYDSNCLLLAATSLSSSLHPPPASHPCSQSLEHSTVLIAKHIVQSGNLSYLEKERKSGEFGEMQRKDGQEWERRGNVEERKGEMKRELEGKEKESRDCPGIRII